MTITLEEIKKISKLSRIEFDDQELKEIQDEFNAIINAIDRLNELNTEGIVPTYSAPLDVEELREDIIKPSWDREKILQNAPEHEDGAFKAPTIVE
ncbi:MAG: Asp-tRNA(Asn)/Glu-tRNA(Gln) amidotransferase subunit GatC [Clostridiales bacterium]|jgi:aspartyl-tRNA(Asn)/glutamyl-tRNA(Gln) amidotransferase subunit C|nr:Asp-tRNA(Asn)/Glu-tRNA(Gln) amidotransferase subunit GatC [Clostridiales bacterium]